MNRTRSRRKFRIALGRDKQLMVALCVVAAGLAVAACSSSSKGASTGSSSTAGSSSQAGASSQAGSSSQTGSASPATGTAIPVGFMCTCSAAGGYGAEIVPGEDVFKAWVSTVNAAGGVDGHPLHVTYEDDAGNPGTSVSDVHTLISDHVVAIVDDSNSGHRLGIHHRGSPHTGRRDQPDQHSLLHQPGLLSGRPDQRQHEHCARHHPENRRSHQLRRLLLCRVTDLRRERPSAPFGRQATGRANGPCQ